MVISSCRASTRLQRVPIRISRAEPEKPFFESMPSNLINLQETLAISVMHPSSPAEANVNAGGQMGADIQNDNLGSSGSAASRAPKNGLSAVPTANGPGSAALVRKAGGPRTPQGKEPSKHNAITHGIFSKAVVLKGESQ